MEAEPSVAEPKIEATAPSRPANGRRRLPRWRLALRITLILSLVLGVWTFRRPLFERNLGVVDAGRVYRGAQPSGDVSGLFGRLKVASVLNLRGGSWSNSWYAEEVGAAKTGDVDFYDFPMSATQRPSRREMLSLWDLLGRCRYPLFIHCKSGSDRTGLACALYRMRQGEPPERAISSFSLAYGHVAFGGPEHLHEPIDEYAAWLASRSLTHTPDRFLNWLLHDYHPQGEPGPIRIRPGPRHDRPNSAKALAEARTSRESPKHLK